MATATGTIQQLAGFNGDLTRKGLTGTVLLCPWETRPLITTLCGTGGQIAYDDRYLKTGRAHEDALKKTIDDDYSEIGGWGVSTWVRRDTKRRRKQMQFAAIETRKLTKELHTGLTMPNQVTRVNGSAEVRLDHTDRPATKYWGALAVTTDGVGPDAFHMAEWFPKCCVSDRDDEPWGDDDDPVMYGVTLDALFDDEAGVVASEWWFGPGFLSRALAMGFVVPALTP